MGVFDEAQAERGGVFEQAAAERPISDAEAEDARPKNIGEIAWSGLRNAFAGGAKSISNIAAGAGGLLAKGLDKIHMTNGLEDQAKIGHERMNEQIDKALGVQNADVGDQLMQTLGGAGVSLALPIEKIAPIAAKALPILPPYLAGLASRLGVNAGYGAIEGEGMDHPVAGAVGGLAGGALAEGAKALGGKIIGSYLKAGHTGAAEGLDKPWFISQEMGGTGPQMARNVDTRLGELKATQAQIIQQKGALPMPILQALQNVENNINTSDAIAKNLGSLPAARAQLKDYVDDLMPIIDQQTGDAPLKMVWDVKKKAASDATSLYRAHNSGADVKGMTKQGVSAMVATELNGLLEKGAPELTDLNPEFSKLIPVAKALERRNRIAGQHNPIGLDELAALDAGMNFMMHGEPLGMTLPLIQRASKSPYVGQLLRDASAKSSRLLGVPPTTQNMTSLTGNGYQE